MNSPIQLNVYNYMIWGQFNHIFRFLCNSVKNDINTSSMCNLG